MRIKLQVGVDIGGTFTDVVTRDEQGQLQYFKIPTTRKDESLAVLDSIDRICQMHDTDASSIDRFAHGTTVATNAILERKGARVGLLTTRGFRDVLEIGRQMRHGLYDIILHPETPTFLVPRSRRLEVTERVGSNGEVLVELDEADVLRAAARLIDDDVEAIVICFLFSFLNSSHEMRAAELIRDAYPGITLAVSHEVNPMYREYERTLVTAFDAYVKPVIDRYLSRLENGLAKSGVTVPLQIMQSRGGLMASSIARRRPVRLFLSGPAAGVVGAQRCATAAGFPDVITVDVGGTSSDIAVIKGGHALIRPEGLIDGFTVRVPMVDVNSIGSGGGSLAWIDVGGAMRVGPRSAGSEPGPACFGRGGLEPTVTDASIVLGYLNPDNFAGGALSLDAALAANAIAEKIAHPLGLTVAEAALGIHRIVNAQMAEGIRSVSTRQGLDPRPFTLLPMGGGGAVHACSLARELGMRTILIPRYPGVLCAAGLLASPVDHEVTGGFGQAMQGLEVESVLMALESLNQQCAALMRMESLMGAEVSVSHYADICFIGQGYWLEVPLFVDEPDMLERAYDEFVRLHQTVYGHSDRSPARVVNLRVVHRAGGDHHIDSAPYLPRNAPLMTGSRPILLDRREGFVDAAVYAREALPSGFEFDGPAVVEQSDTTIVVDARWRAAVDTLGNLILKATY
jgi:N-methylhydantoinase A